MDIEQVIKSGKMTLEDVKQYSFTGKTEPQMTVQDVVKFIRDNKNRISLDETLRVVKIVDEARQETTNYALFCNATWIATADTLAEIQKMRCDLWCEGNNCGMSDE